MKRVTAQAVNEGAGVTVHRTIGTPALRHLDPFLMLDHFASADPDEYIAGFPDHPHRGFITVTYMLDGHMRHRDSMGNEGNLRAGDVQWMKAASGVIHSEMPQQEQGLMRGFQLWLNLPAAEKLADPAYQEIAAADVPVITEAGTRIKVLCGTYGTDRGPIEDPFTAVIYLDVALPAAGEFSFDAPVQHNTFVYVFEGRLELNKENVDTHTLVVPNTGALRFSCSRPARFILLSGRPLREPIVQYGPFVMNSREEIEQALADYRTGQLVRTRAIQSAATPTAIQAIPLMPRPAQPRMA